MPGNVKTTEDEHLWAKAKGIVQKQYPKVAEDSDKYWKLVQGVYKQSKGEKSMFTNYPNLEKSRVKARQRRTKKGKVMSVNEKKSVANTLATDKPLMAEYPSLQKSLGRTLKKSLEFTKTGKEVKESVMIKIAQLQGELSVLVENWKTKKTIDSAKVDVSESEEPQIKTVGVTDADLEEPWQIRSKRRAIERLYAIHRNLKDNQKVKLSTYELEEYGL